MESTSQSSSESEGDNNSVKDCTKKQKKKSRFEKRKSSVSGKKIKDRAICIIFCCFNHVRSIRNSSK